MEQEMLREIANHPFVPILGLVLGVIGSALAVIFYFKSRRIRKLRFDFSSQPLVEGLSEALEGLEVSFRGKRQERITVTRWAFWNAGNDTIRSDDFTDDVLRIVCRTNVNVLDCILTYVSNGTNKISVSLSHSSINDKWSLPVVFDYLDSNDGAVIQLVHDGPSSTRFILEGTIKGNCSIALAESPAYRQERGLRYFGPLSYLSKSRAYGWFNAAACVIIGLYGLIVPLIGKGSWWLLALSPIGFVGAWVMTYAYALGQVPLRYQRNMNDISKCR